MGIPAINIGNRQQGRERAENVIDVPNERDEIVAGIQKALYDSEFIEAVRKMENPYGTGDSAERIVNILRHVTLDNLVQKRFVD